MEKCNVFWEKGKLSLRYVGPFEILERIGPVAYLLRVPEELVGTLRFVEEPVEIMDCKVKSIKRSGISIVEVRWNSKRGPEFTWEREEYMKSKYPQLFVDRVFSLRLMMLGEVDRETLGLACGVLLICSFDLDLCSQPPPPPLATSKTMPQRLGRLEEEVQGLRQDVRTLRGLLERSMTDQGRFSTWMITCMTQLMEASGQAYQAFDGTFRGSSPAAF
ncbi:hypothetical protein Tco_0344214 [Tanacetum coccineum]